MATDLITEFKTKFSLLQDQPLSGGIVAKNLHISDNGSGELTLYGDFTITLKVLDLTTDGAPNLNSLMTFTQQVITSKLRGGGYKGGVRFFKYDSSTKSFNFQKNQTYSLRYNFNCAVNLTQINMLNQLRGNDFILAVVDRIGYQFIDQYGKRNNSSGIADGRGGPAVVCYNDWIKNRYIGAHEFFHTLGLKDIEDHSKRDQLMYHLGDNTSYNVSDKERGDIMNFLMQDISNMTKGAYSYTNPNFNSQNLLRTFLNSKINGIKYNKAKFR